MLVAGLFTIVLIDVRQLATKCPDCPSLMQPVSIRRYENKNGSVEGAWVVVASTCLRGSIDLLILVQLKVATSVPRAAYMATRI